MKMRNRRVMVCDCEKTMPLSRMGLEKACHNVGGEGELFLNTQLCRSQIENYQAALESGDELLVACTQEAPLFSEIAEDFQAGDRVSFTNIRETAGWSHDAEEAAPKMAALLAAAAMDSEPFTSVTLASEGNCLIYGPSELALQAARQLGDRLKVTVLISEDEGSLPPEPMTYPVFAGRIRSLSGYLGAFEAEIESYAAPSPSSRSSFAFEDWKGATSLSCDLVLDLSGGTPFLPAHERHDGYLRPDPGDLIAVQKALLDASGLVGEFEKPRYVQYDESICAHSRSRQQGCNRCIDACPLSAIQSLGDIVEVDPHVCGGCGLCAASCPTGAMDYRLPDTASLADRIRVLLSSYRSGGGENPVLLFHDGQHGRQLLSYMARLGNGLPANVLPVEMNEVTQAGFDIYLCSLAYGAAAAAILVPPSKREDLPVLEETLELVENISEGLGYGRGHFSLIDALDPDTVEGQLETLPQGEAATASNFLPLGNKRSRSYLALGHLHDNAPAPVDRIDLPQGAPFGRIEIDTEGCTLCQACIPACPVGALLDDPDRPWIGFQEEACVQCGLCQSTCPENVITLIPQVDFTDEAKKPRTLNEAEPFHCIRCGTPFGVKQSIERIVEKLSGLHSMYMQQEQIDRVRMCEDCRVAATFEDPNTPMAAGPRPAMHTTEEDLRLQEERRKNREANRTGSGSSEPS
ncbi:4Fe-4S binding protein [Fodinicurvata sediminis]|uniref:4Fe-4S binding protein n=1 Tax=Fodinicurvata sediminis TaxID=1121832 RepID=UPI0003B70FB7|nr:4Fe-4S binding protein [Fodinicurvata sediminis]